MIKAIIFDVGGVLYLSRTPEYIFMQKALNLYGKDYTNGIAKYIKLSSINKISEKEAFEKMSKYTNISAKKIKNIFIREYRKRFWLNKYLLNLIKRLKKEYKISIISNQFSLSYHLLINNKLIKHFFMPIFSHQVKTKKPEEKVYRIALKKLRVPANQTIFVDDREFNLIPAKKLGMKTILFKNNKQLVKDLKKLGVKIYDKKK